jgi:glucokinase
VSYERVLSGPGLYQLYLFLRDTGRHEEPPWLAERVASGDPSAAISQSAQERADPLCVATLNLFCEIYGAEAGNMALRALTYGGVYLGGGVAPKNLTFLSNGSFAKGFLDKGPFAKMLREIDVFVALDPETALLGAVAYARRLLQA